MSEPPDDPRSDPQLIEAINAGDRDAFEALYRRHRDWAVSVAHRFTADRALALDAMQNAFLHLLRRFPGFTLTAKFTTFLYPVIRHEAMALRRKANRATPGGEHLDTLPADPSADSPEQRRDRLVEALAHLPEERREVLLMRFADGFTLNEIAEALELPLGTVKSRLHLALKTLRDDPRTKIFFGP